MRKGSKHTKEAIEKNRLAKLGRKHTEETKIKIGLSNQGKTAGKSHIAWNKGLTKEIDERVKKLGLNSGKSREGKFYQNKNHFKKGKKLTKEQIKKCLKRREKSSLELKFENIINKLNLPYKFVGNGDFFIERKNPDFINCNGEKIAIEVYYRRHKEQFRKGVEQWRLERKKTFSKYGWEILFFDETQTNENTIKSILGGD